jgi:hypothetical protein
MSQSSSLTDAVKQTAGISLTDAVKKATGTRGWPVADTAGAVGWRDWLAAGVRSGWCRRMAAAGVCVGVLVAPAPRGGERAGLVPAQHSIHANVTVPAGLTGKRVALIIGNSAYQHAAELDNPRHDAGDMGIKLRQLGFVVIEGVDLDKAAFDAKLREFALALHGADVGVLFYAGHGLQVSGLNYLMPVDAKLSTPSTLEVEMVRLDVVQRTMETEARTNILFFDACRVNPLARTLARAMGTRATEIGRGLAAVGGGVDTLISFSTQPGNVALDGPGRNSPFSAALLRHIQSPAADLSTILIAVRNEVVKQTERQQVPWEHSALTQRIYLHPEIVSAAEAQLPLGELP